MAKPVLTNDDEIWRESDYYLPLNAAFDISQLYYYKDLHCYQAAQYYRSSSK